jgi:hypothetical protein
MNGLPKLMGKGNELYWINICDCKHFFYLFKTNFVWQLPTIMIGFCERDGDGWTDSKTGLRELHV